MPEKARSRLLRYGWALISVACALLALALLEPRHWAYVGLLFYYTTLLLAWHCGIGPALTALVLVLATTTLFFPQPLAQNDVPVWLRIARPVIGVAILITIGLARRAQRRARQQAAESQRLALDRLAHRNVILASIGDGVVATDGNGHITYLNAVAERLIGCTTSDAVGQPLVEVLELVQEHTRKPAENPVTRVLREGVVVGLANSTLLVAKDGTERPIDDCAAPIKDESGHIDGVVMIFREISDRRRADLMRQQLGFLVESSNDAIIGKSPEGIITSWNKGAENLYGYTAEEAVGKSVGLLVPEVIADELPRIMEKINRGEHVDHYETIRQKKGGECIDVSVAVSPIKDASGRILGASAIARDISESKQLQNELRRRAQELADNDRRKDEFLAMLSHELRNPMTPIWNAVAIMSQPQTEDPELTWARGIIERQVRLLTRLIDDLLDVSRITQGKIQLRRERVELGAIVAHAAEAVRPMIERREQHLEVDPLPAPVALEADPARLEQVLTNLLNNASRYTDPGGHIRLQAKREGDEAVVSVSDDGHGIDPEFLPHVFELFTQAERTPDRSQGGLGIGLTLVRHLIDMHGGSVEGKSGGIGQGSEFIVRIPALSAETEPREPGSADPLLATVSTEHDGHSGLPRRVLVIDDHIDTARTLARLVRLWGQDVRTANDGATAIDVARAYQPEVVLCDIGMPVMDGYQIARQMRDMPGLKQALLVAVTGYGQHEDRMRSQQAGFDLHMTKPIDPSALQKLLRASK